MKRIILLLTILAGVLTAVAAQAVVAGIGKNKS